jgi:hypothetical protein
MDKAKVRLSAKEAELVNNADWILTKNQILQKAKFILEEVQVKQQQFLRSDSSVLPGEVIAIAPKISKGENYKGLPYLVLDHPRFFGKDDHFAIRTLFWWGNFFSITLHLSGIYKTMYEKKIEASFTSLKENSFFIGVSNDQWEHHFETSNYLPVKEMNDTIFKTNLINKEFIKLAKRFSLKQWDDAEDILFTSFCQLISWLTNQVNYRDGETTLLPGDPTTSFDL